MKFLKKGIKTEDKYIPVHYSKDSRTDGQKGLTIYAKSILKKLPAELSPKNDSNSMTDYFETDRTFISIESPLFSQVKEIYQCL